MPTLLRATNAVLCALSVWSLVAPSLLHAQESKPIPVPKTAVRAPALHESLEARWKDQREEAVKLELTAPQNRRYTFSVSGPPQDRFADHVQRSLLPLFTRPTRIEDTTIEGIVPNPDGSLTYNGTQYQMSFRINGSTVPLQALTDMRTDFGKQMREIVYGARLERFDKYNEKTVYFGLLVDLELVQDKEHEEALLDMVKAVIEGHTVDEFEVSEEGRLLYQKKALSLRFFYPKDNRSTYFTIPEHDELTSKFQRHIRYIYDKRTEEVEKTPAKVTEFEGPALVETLKTRPKVEEGESARSLAMTLPHLRRILAFLSTAHPALHARLQRELTEQSDLRVVMLPVNSLKETEKSFHFSHVIKHDGRRILIAANKWRVLDKHRVEAADDNAQKNRSYCMLYALLEGILPHSDINRSAKAHELTMELVFLEQDKGSLDAIDKETVEKFVTAFATSSQTDNLRAYVRDMRLLAERDGKFLDTLGQPGADMKEVLTLLEDFAKDEASRSLAKDFREVLGADNQAPRTDSVNLALWRLFQSMQKDPHWANQIYTKQELLREAASLVLRGDIESTEDLKEALELLKESRRPKPVPKVESPSQPSADFPVQPPPE